MKRKTLHKIFGSFIAIGFFVTLGATCISDCESTNFVLSTVVALIGLLFMGVGAVGLNRSGYDN